jgi:sirohydrochlorin ferrochelatase
LEQFGARLRVLGRFAEVRIALLEEEPSLAEALGGARGPAIVIGLFAGDGLHAGRDVPRLIGALDRNDVAFAGPVGGWPELADLVAAGVEAERSVAPTTRPKR